MARKRKVGAKAVTEKEPISEGSLPLISWVFTVMGWHLSSVPDAWLERLPHPSFAAFVVKTMIGEKPERWGFPPNPKANDVDDREWHGSEWEPAVERKLDLEAKRTGEPSHPVIKDFWLRWQCLRDVMRWQDSSKLDDVGWAAMPLQIETGAATLDALLKGDIEFFRDIVRMMENEKGVNRKADWIKGIQVIEIAFDLFTPDSGNPSKEQVMQATEKLGVKVADWPSMFKDCRLNFLKYKKERRGRPRKK